MRELISLPFCHRNKHDNELGRKIHSALVFTGWVRVSVHIKSNIFSEKSPDIITKHKKKKKENKEQNYEKTMPR